MALINMLSIVNHADCIVRDHVEITVLYPATCPSVLASQCPTHRQGSARPAGGIHASCSVA